jgi:hypothetical protein
MCKLTSLSYGMIREMLGKLSLFRLLFGGRLRKEES